MRRLTWGLAPVGPAIVALGILTLIAAHRHPGESFGGGSGPALFLQLLAGLGTASGGAYLVWQRSARLAGALLLATAAAVFLQQLPLPESGSSLLFTAALAGGAMTSTLAGVAALVVSGHRVADVLVSGVAIACPALLLGLLPAATFDPRGTGCFACPRNLVLVHADARLHGALVRVGLTTTAATCAALALLALLRVIRRPVLLRSATAPVLVCGAAVAGLGAVGFVHQSQAGLPGVDPTTRALWLAQCVLLVLAAAGIALRALRARLLRGRVAAMVLEALPSPAELRAGLATALGDPRLEIVFPRAGGGAVDANGREARPAHGKCAVTEVVRRGEVVAELRHIAELSQAPERVTQAALGAGLALEQASLHARLQAELADLTASRIRIVEVGDSERQRLERNLHDGAQQRLIALSVALQLTPDPNPEVRHARAELQNALDKLRAIAHGIHPVSLTEAGLAGAVRELTEDSQIPVRITTTTDRRPSPAAEAALYRLVLDSVRLAERHGNGAPVTVRIEPSDDSVSVLITAPGVDAAAARPALEHAADRLAALHSELTITTAGNDLILKATVPCAS